MTQHSRWETVLAKRREIDPGIDDPARRAAARDQLNATIIGYHLAQMRKNAGLKQAEVAATLGVSAARISQMENGAVKRMQVETIAAYIAALGGHLRLVADFGETSTTFVDYTVEYTDRRVA
jgi:predicted XRE-type DNA-binding protein